MGAALVGGRREDHRRRPLDDVAGRHLCGIGRDWADRESPGQVDHGQHVHHGLRYGRGTQHSVCSPYLVDGRVSGGVSRDYRDHAPPAAVVLPPLRKPGHRTGAQRRVRRAARADVLWPAGRLSRVSPGIRSGTCGLAHLLSSPGGTAALPSCDVCYADAVLLYQSRDELGAERSVREPGCCSIVVRCEDNYEIRWSAAGRSTLCPRARPLYHAADEQRADLRDHFLTIRVTGWDHRSEAVLTTDRHGHYQRRAPHSARAALA